MSGHSHWATIKHKKGIEDAKRGKIFSKMSRIISVTAKDGGDPNMNAKLRKAIDAAKKVRMPKENIEKAIKKGTGELEGEQLEEITYEGLATEGINLIIEVITDNRNRTLGELKQILQKYNGKIADEGSVKWAFEHIGFIIQEVKDNKEELELKAIDEGALDVKEIEEYLEIQTKPDELDKIKQSFPTAESSSLGWQAKEEIEVSDKAKDNLNKIIEDLDDNDDVQNIYSNLKT